MTATIAEQLRAAAAGLQADRVSVASLMGAHGTAAQGSLLLMLAVPCLLPIPGTGAVFGFGLLAMAVAMWRGLPDSGLPRRVAELELSRPWAQRLLSVLATLYGLAARLTRARLRGWLGGPLRRVLAGCLGAMAILLLLPIPFGNVIPALALLLIGLGLVFQDGLAVALGLVMAAVATLLTVVLLFGASVWVRDWIARVFV